MVLTQNRQNLIFVTTQKTDDIMFSVIFLKKFSFYVERNVFNLFY